MVSRHWPVAVNGAQQDRQRGSGERLRSSVQEHGLRRIAGLASPQSWCLAFAQLVCHQLPRRRRGTLLFCDHPLQHMTRAGSLQLPRQSTARTLNRSGAKHSTSPVVDDCSCFVGQNGVCTCFATPPCVGAGCFNLPGDRCKAARRMVSGLGQLRADSVVSRIELNRFPCEHAYSAQ